ncbi:MAG: carbohydrate ABC transporter permease, partial [Pseudomonadota bacterium]
YVLTITSLLLAILYFFVLGPQRSRASAAPVPTSSLDEAIDLRRQRARRFEMVSLPPFRPHRLLPPEVTQRLGRIAFNLGLVVILLWSALPVLALIMMSLSPPADLIRVPPSLFPSAVTVDNYVSVLAAEGKTGPQAKRVPISITNSFIVGASVAVINVFLGTLAGYAFARHARSRFFGMSLWGLLLTRMIPALTLVLPFFIIFRMLGLLDTHLALIIAYSSILLPLCSWMMKTSFESIPISLERAALIDGCTRTTMLLKILMPAVRPGIIAALIFAFLVSWNEFLFALILTSTPSAQTIPVVIAGFLSQAQFYEYGPLFAASVLAILPPVLVAFFFQRYLVQGVLSGAVKG